MMFTNNVLLVSVLIGVGCGVIATLISGGTLRGFFVAIVVGVVGALMGEFGARAMHLPGHLFITVAGHPFPIVWSILGGVVSVALVKLIS